MAETINLGIVGIKNMGEYNSQTAYEKLNVVTYEGSTYCALKDTVGNLPTNTDYWQLYAQKGGKGDTGDTGPQGPTPVKGVDYYTDSDKQEIEEDLADDIAAEVSSSLGNLTTATPLVASSVSEMTDTTRVYVNSTDGHWYWYDGEDWQDGGIYQATVAIYDTTLTVKDGVADSKSIGDKINQDYKKPNLFNVDNLTANKRYKADGDLENATNYYICEDIIECKDGDSIFCCYYDTDHYIQANISQVIIVDATGTFIERITSNASNYVATDDCFIKIVVAITTVLPNIENFNIFLNYYEKNDLNNHNYINLNKKDIDKSEKFIEDITKQYNYFNIEDSIINQLIGSGGNLSYVNNGYFITNFIKVKSGDVLRSYNFGDSTNGFTIIQVGKYNTNKQFIERSLINARTYTADFNGYVKFNISKNTSDDETYIRNNYAISKNEELDRFYPYKKYLINYIPSKVSLYRNSSTSYTIKFGKFTTELSKTVDASSNSNNWNLKTIKNGENVIVPAGTDILGPVKINDNTDFIGGVHGDEITNNITVTVDGTAYDETDLQSISSISGDTLTITMKSTCYDQIVGDAAFDRYMIITFEPNRIHVVNNFKALKNLNLRIACNGGLIACRNPIIKNIIMNNSYFDTPPTTSINNRSRYNTSGTINTIYGSITVNNIKGYENENYRGYLNVFYNENPVRQKIYLSTYDSGTYPLVTGDIIAGEFEYLFS